MSGISGSVRENVNFEGKKIGLFVGKVICINPSREEYKDILGIDLKEDSKATDYLGESKEGNVTLRLNVWLEDTKTGFRSPVQFFLENKERTNKDGTKFQFINDTGITTWADDEDNLKDWFKKTEYRKAKVGEEEMYGFLRNWLNKIDFKKEGASLHIDWKKLMKGNVKELSEQIGGAFAGEVGSAATVRTVEKDGETKEYQSIYNKAFFPAYSLKNFRLVDYSKPEVIEGIKRKQLKDQKPHEKFVVNITDGEFGCRDAFSLKELHEFDSSTYLPSSEKVIDDADSSY